MIATKLLSSTEQTILIMLALSICLTFYKDISNKIVDSYNENIKLEQIKKMNRANGKEEFHFTIYDGSRSLDMWETVRGLQIITAPILILLVSSRKIGKFIFSFFLNFVTFFSYFAWAHNAYWARMMNESYRIYENSGFRDYLFPGSSVLQQISFILISILMVLQFFILARFTTEKFNDKISPA